MFFGQQQLQLLDFKSNGDLIFLPSAAPKRMGFSERTPVSSPASLSEQTAGSRTYELGDLSAQSVTIRSRRPAIDARRNNPTVTRMGGSKRRRRRAVGAQGLRLFIVAAVQRCSA